MSDYSSLIFLNNIRILGVLVYFIQIFDTYQISNFRGHGDVNLVNYNNILMVIKERYNVPMKAVSSCTEDMFPE